MSVTALIASAADGPRGATARQSACTQGGIARYSSGDGGFHDLLFRGGAVRPRRRQSVAPSSSCVKAEWYRERSPGAAAVMRTWRTDALRAHCGPAAVFKGRLFALQLSAMAVIAIRPIRHRNLGTAAAGPGACRKGIGHGVRAHVSGTGNPRFQQVGTSGACDLGDAVAVPATLAGLRWLSGSGR